MITASPFESYRLINPDACAGAICAQYILEGSFPGTFAPGEKERLMTTLAERARKKPKTVTAAAGLLEALNFIGVASKEDGDEMYKSHIVLDNGQAVAFNGVISAGFPIEEELLSCPHYGRLHAALKRCGETMSISQLDNGRLSITSGKLKVIVPALDIGDMKWSAPDANIAPISPSIKEGFIAIGKIAEENGDRIVTSSVLLQANTMVTTTGKALAEYWHGNDLPPNLVLPRSFINAVVKHNTIPVGFGYSGSSVTFHYENKAWLKTIRFNDDWPNYSLVFNDDSSPKTINEDFWTAFDMILPFCDKDKFFIKPGMLASHKEDSEGARYDCFTATEGGCMNSKDFNRLRHLIKSMDYSSGERAYFFGDNVRGVFTKFIV